MENKEIARIIYKNSRDGRDIGLEILEIMSLVGQGNVSEVLNVYKQILLGKVKIAEVFVKNELSKEQMSEIEKKVQSKFDDVELVFEFNTSKDNEAGIMIKIGDDILDGTV